MNSIKVLLIEDDPMVQEINRQYIEKVEGYLVVGHASNGEEGLQLVRKLKPELVIIDIYMPQLDGFETIKQFRQEGLPVDVMAITAASDIETIHKVLQYGAVDYILKPFKFERIKRALEQYYSFRLKLEERNDVQQHELDQLLTFNEDAIDEELLPKGLHHHTLNKIIEYISSEKSPVSSEEVAESIGIARVTARRYLDYLEKKGKVNITVQYGGVGRPVNRYGL
ncbi:two-component system response regulator DctR [Peribacillus deserti]|uniref:Two-component system response regulator DctR n=1 Tax=Peribacillus deserti TaxID=673318 RepID=A0ABS2QNW7_9BACI|nr:response regulator [Peribacillus deserti]MBM7694178.1 two-component system response regulator DctR [Peribacillus deserti]